MVTRREELLAKIPDYRRGDVTPSEAHQLSQLLEDPDFEQEALREELLVEALEDLDEVPMPRNLVQNSVKAAVGKDFGAGWFSLDTLLIALGVGVGCAGIAQLLRSYIPDIPFLGGTFSSVATFIGGNSIGLVAGAILLMVAMLAAGAWWAFKAARS